MIFFEFTKNFINTRSISHDDKLDFHEALRSELRSQNTTISVSDFGDQHFDDDTRKEYESFMELKKFPKNSILKDDEYICAKLKRRRRITLNSDVYISTPSDNFKELVEIMPSEDTDFTMVKIKGRVTGQD